MELIDIQELVYSNKRLSIEEVMDILLEFHYKFVNDYSQTDDTEEEHLYFGELFITNLCYNLLTKVDHIYKEEQEDQQ